MQKRERGNLQQDFLPIPVNIESVERPYGGMRLTFDVPERREIVMSNQKLGGLVHSLRIQHSFDVPDKAALMRRRRAAVHNAVDVMAPQG